MIGQLGIVPASKRSVTDSAYTLPQVRGTLAGWFQRLILTKVNKSIKDREVVEVQRKLECFGVIQPFSARELKVKPEGERSWNWKMLHTTSDVDLRPDDEFYSNGVRYRVMSKFGYQEYGYSQYELIQDFEPAQPYQMASNG